MEPVRHLFKTTRTARYFVLTYNDLPIEEYVFVLHGYGMNAGDFVRNFDSLVKPGRMIIAPEGLSRFYRKGFAGEVVASWMTREDRLSEIDDYIDFLDHLYFELVPAESASRVVVVGFSQGASTASRWVMKGNAPVLKLVLWSGEFAPDVLPVSKQKPKIWNIIGNEDEFIPLERFHKQSEYLISNGFITNDMVFEGKHVIDGATLTRLWNEIHLE